MSDIFIWENYENYSAGILNESDRIMGCGNIFDPYDPIVGDILCYAMFAVRQLSAIVSLISCCFVVFIICLFKRYIFDTQRLILYLSISALFSSIMYSATEVYIFFSPNDVACAAFIFFLTLSIWSVIIWNLNVTFKLFITIVLWKTSPKWFEKMFIANALIIPLIFAFLTIIPVFIPEKISFECTWIDRTVTPDYDIVPAQAFYGSIWVFPSLIAFLTVIIAYSIIFVIMLRIRIKKQDLVISKVLVQEIKSLILYPVVILAAYSIPLLLALINLSDSNIQLTILYFLILIATFTRPLVGFLISVVYISKKDNRKHLNLKYIKLEFLSRLKRTKIKEYPITQMDHNFKQNSLHLEHSFRLSTHLSSEKIIDQLQMEQSSPQPDFYTNTDL